MQTMQTWYVDVNNERHEITYEGRKVSGNVKLRIDGTLKEYPAVFVDNVATFCAFDIDGSELLLKLMDDRPLGLIQDGIYIETGLPLELEAIEGYRTALQPQESLLIKHKAGMGSFLTFVLLTYLNLFLIIIGSPFSFPFSADVPQFLMILGWYSLEGSISFIPLMLVITSFVFASVYLILYLLAKKRTWPILTALILIGIDTVVVILSVAGNLAHGIIDLVFHAWVLWSIIRLYITRRQLS